MIPTEIREALTSKTIVIDDDGALIRPIDYHDGQAGYALGGIILLDPPPVRWGL